MQSIAPGASKDVRPGCSRAVALRGSSCDTSQDEHLRVTVMDGDHGSASFVTPSPMAARPLRRLRLVLVAQADPVHRIGQAVLVTAERGEVEILIGGVHHVEAAGEAGIGVKNLAGLVAEEHADAGQLGAIEWRGAEIVFLDALVDLLTR